MREVELITRLHSAKAISIECVSGGRSTMTADAVIAVVALIAKNHPFGMDAVMTKYLDDGKAAERCVGFLVDQAQEWKCPRADLAPFFAIQAVAAFSNKPLVSQRQSLKSLHKRHGAYANRSKHRIKKFNVSLKQAQARDDKAGIARYEALIESERRLLDAHAEKKAAESDVCPRCSGSGTVAMRICPECSASGHIAVDIKRMRAYIKKSGVMMSEKVFNAMWNYFDSCQNHLHYSAGDAMKALAVQMKMEKCDEL